MSTRFIVDIQGGDQRATDALRAAGVPAASPPLNRSGDVIIDWVSAFVQARDAEAARERVTQALPSDGAYVVVRVEQIKSD